MRRGLKQKVFRAFICRHSSKYLIAEHELAHLPFRDWCPHCVRGEGVSAAHQQRKQEETQVPFISVDYMGLTKREPEEGENPIIVLIDRKSKMKHANVGKNKGADDHYAIEIVALDIINMGILLNISTLAFGCTHDMSLNYIASLGNRFFICLHMRQFYDDTSCLP